MTNISSGILSSLILDVLVFEDDFLDVIKEVILGGDFDLFVLAGDDDCFIEEGILVSIYMVFLNYF
jgi:hypothetical protein